MLKTVLGNITLHSLPRDRDCPGHIISFKCIIHSNGDDALLTWHITLPDQQGIIIHHSNAKLTSFQDQYVRSKLDEYKIETTINEINHNSTIILKYTSKAYVESTIHIKIPKDDTRINGGNIECIRDQEQTVFTVLAVDKIQCKLISYRYVFITNSTNFFYTTAPQTPQNFKGDKIVYEADNIITTFEWDPPASQDVVDSYSITITPVPKSLRNSSISVRQSPWIVDLDYNIIYNVGITAVNCAGRSETVLIHDIEHSNNNIASATRLAILYPARMNLHTCL